MFLIYLTCFRTGWVIFSECLFSLTRERPENGSDIHLLDLSAGASFHLSGILVGSRRSCFVVCLLNEPWAMRKSATRVNATSHDLNNTKKTMPNMYWNELSQKMHNLVMWSITSSCQLSPTPLKIRHHMPQKWGTSTQLSFLNTLAYSPTSTHFRFTDPAKIM